MKKFIVGFFQKHTLSALLLVIGFAVGVAFAASSTLINLTNDASPTSDDLVYVVNDPGGTPADRKVTLGNLTTLIQTGYLPSIDEDNMASDSAAHVPTQQSTKAYADTHINNTSNPHSVTAAQAGALANIVEDTTPQSGGNHDLNAHVLFDATGIDDDDCTGDQGKLWWDSTDSRWEGCNANSGTPLVFGSGSGDVVGPASSTDNAVARYDSITGKLLQNSVVTLDDNGVMTFPAGGGVIVTPNSTAAQYQDYYEDTDDGGNKFTVTAQAMDGNYTLTLPSFNAALLASSQVGSTGLLAKSADLTSMTGAISTSGNLNGLTPAVSIGNCEGAHDGSENASTLSDSGESLTVDAYIGMQLYNITDGSSCTVTDNDATTITCTLAGGTDNDWDSSDVWQVGPGPFQSGSVFYISAATTIAHPATAGYVAGYFAAAAQIITIDPYSVSMTINFSDDGVFTDPGAGDEIDGDGTQGDFIWIHNASTTEAYSHGVNGSWADGGAS